MKTNNNRRSYCKLGLLAAFVAVATMGASPHIARAVSVVDWGWNIRGELGDGTTTDRHTPVAVSGMTNGITTVTGGGFHNLAVKNGGLWAWGGNPEGQLGDGTTTQRNTPVPVSGLGSGVTAVAAGYGHSLAIEDGGVWAWGENDVGEIGDSAVTLLTLLQCTLR